MPDDSANQRGPTTSPGMPGLVAIAVSGHIVPTSGMSVGHDGLDVNVIGDLLLVLSGDGQLSWQRTVEGLAAFVKRARAQGQVAIGWGVFRDEAEVVYVYDRADSGFGYAFNLTVDWCSEWGYAPWSNNDDDQEDQ